MASAGGYSALNSAPVGVATLVRTERRRDDLLQRVRVGLYCTATLDDDGDILRQRGQALVLLESTQAWRKLRRGNRHHLTCQHGRVKPSSEFADATIW